MSYEQQLHAARAFVAKIERDGGEAKLFFFQPNSAPGVPRETEGFQSRMWVNPNDPFDGIEVLYRTASDKLLCEEGFHFYETTVELDDAYATKYTLRCVQRGQEIVLVTPVEPALPEVAVRTSNSSFRGSRTVGVLTVYQWERRRNGGHRLRLLSVELR